MHRQLFVVVLKKMSAQMNESSWLASLMRAKASEKQDFLAIHVAAELRGVAGVAPIILQTADEYWRAPSQLEAACEFCLRHLHGRVTPLAGSGITPQALLANRAMEEYRHNGDFLQIREEGESAADSEEGNEGWFTWNSVLGFAAVGLTVLGLTLLAL